MSKAKICLSFDDGRIDNYNIVYPILKKYGLCATLNITTGFIEKDPVALDSAKGYEPMDKNMVIELFESGVFEIGAHGHLHRNSTEDIKHGIDVLAEWLGKEWQAEGIGFASPYDEMSEDNYTERKKELYSLSICYVRGNRYRTSLGNRGLHKLLYYLSRIVKKYSFVLNNITCLQSLIKRQYYRSVIVRFDTPVSDIKKIIKMATRYNKSLIFALHSILEKDDSMYGNEWSYDKAKFEELCEYLRFLVDRGEIEIVTNKQLFDYGNSIC